MGFRKFFKRRTSVKRQTPIFNPNSLKHIYLIGANPNPAKKAAEITKWIKARHTESPIDLIFTRVISRDVKKYAVGLDYYGVFIHDTPIIIDEMGELPDTIRCIDYRLQTKYQNAKRIVHLDRKEELSELESKFKDLGYNVESLVI